MYSNNQYGVIWDMDGVLIDTGRFHYIAWKAVLGRRGIPFSEEDFRNLFGRNNQSTLEILLGRPPSTEELETISREKEGVFQKEIRGKVELMPGVRALLQAFHDHGWRQAIGSSAPQDNIDQLIEGLNIRNFFQVIYSGSNLPSKPEPEIFLSSAHALKIDPANCLVIEDSLPGIEAAHRSGMCCLAVATTHPLAQLSSADIAVNKLDEIKPSDLYNLVEQGGNHHGG